MKKTFTIVTLLFISMNIQAQTCGYDSTGSCGTTNLTTIGTNDDTITYFQYPAPFGNYFTSGSEQHIYRVAELNAAGMIGASKIDGLGFYVVDTLGGFTNYHEFTITMGCTTDSSFFDTSDIQGLVPVFPSSNHHVSIGWNFFHFPTSYTWDGISNLVVGTCFNMGPPYPFWTGNCLSINSSTSYLSSISKASDGSDQCTDTAHYYSAYYKHPMIQLNYCMSTIGINELVGGAAITIYPNPFTNQTTITFNDNLKHTIKIMDVLGKEIKTMANLQGKEITIDKGEMHAGIYFLQITDQNKNVVNRKIVVE